MGEVGMLLAEKWVEAIFCFRQNLLIELVVGKSIVTFLSVYAAQAALDGSVKDLLYKNLQ